MALSLDALLTGINASIAGAQRGRRAGLEDQRLRDRDEADDARRLSLDSLNTQISEERIRDSQARRQAAETKAQQDAARLTQEQGDRDRLLDFRRNQVGAENLPEGIDTLAPDDQLDNLGGMMQRTNAVDQARALSQIPGRRTPSTTPPRPPAKPTSRDIFRFARDAGLDLFGDDGNLDVTKYGVAEAQLRQMDPRFEPIEPTPEETLTFTDTANAPPSAPVGPPSSLAPDGVDARLEALLNDEGRMMEVAAALTEELGRPVMMDEVRAMVRQRAGELLGGN